MIKLFSPEAFRDYIHGVSRLSFSGNGDVVLQPSSCTVSCELNGTWQLDMRHPYDRERRYSYICKGAVIGVPIKVAREQVSTEQFFRIFEVRETLKDGIQVVAYPVAYEAVYETPMDYYEFADLTAMEMRNELVNLTPQKYSIDINYDTTEKASIYIENSNLQEVINGSQDGTFLSSYGGEMVYDNYTYIIRKHIGNDEVADQNDIRVLYAANMTGMEISETTTDMATRIYPMAEDGERFEGYYVNAESEIDKYPFVYARSIKYDDIQLVDLKDEDDETPWTESQIVTKDVKAAITAKVQELSQKYLIKAHEGDWERTEPRLNSTIIYQDLYDDAFSRADRFSVIEEVDGGEIVYEPIHNIHDNDYIYDRHALRKQLPYGYLFYSYTDAIGVLTTVVFDALPNITNDAERSLIEEAIKEGFKWCETTEIAAYDWRPNITYEDPDYQFLNDYCWIKDEVGWYYGDGMGQGHYIRSGWVEETPNKHYWINADGYWDPQWDDDDTWSWFQDSTGWWYGNKNPDGSVKNYAKEQYIYVTENNCWYWFNDQGYFVDGVVTSWRYGTKDGSDGVKWAYWTVGDETWWFNTAGEISNQLAYAKDYEWRNDGIGKFYGDGKGHWMADCWVEDDSKTHRYLEQDGYYVGTDDESDARYDNFQWSWYGNWTEGWWYGSKYEDQENQNGSSSSGNSEVSVNAGDFPVYDQIAGTNLSSQFESLTDIFSGKKLISAIKDNETVQKLLNSGYFKSSNGKYLLKLKNKIKTSGLGSDLMKNLQEMGYKFNSDQSELVLPDTESPSEETLDPEQKTGTKNYVWGQYMYVKDYEKWYWFDTDGYLLACWLANDKWEWHQDSKGWWYGDGAGTYPAGQWMKIGGKWYFFEESGYADPSTDDFAEEKTGNGESATYDANREGIKNTSSSKTKGEDEETVYNAAREGVIAWIQDGFVADVIDVVNQQDQVLHNSLKTRLTEAAQKDLEELAKPQLSVSIDFNTMVNTPGYAKYSYLKDVYLGDTIYVHSTPHNIDIHERITALEIDCLKNEVSKVTIGEPKNSFIKSIAGLNAKGTIKKWKPEDGLEDGYGGYLLTGFAGTKVTT